MPDYYLTEPTYNALQRLIRSGPGNTAGYGHGGGTRQVGHVFVTADLGGGLYSCIPTAFVPADDQWTDYTDAANVVSEPNGYKLTVHDTYGAVRYGPDGAGRMFWMTFGGNCPCEKAGSGSGHHSPPVTDHCAGWYCCSSTGQVVYLYNCDEVAAFSCPGGSVGSVGSGGSTGGSGGSSGGSGGSVGGGSAGGGGTVGGA